MNEMKLSLQEKDRENNNKGVDFWKFVTSSKEESSEGFTETIQNVFKFSFLIKDGHAKTVPGTTSVAPSDPPGVEEESGNRRQMVLKFDYETYLKSLQYCKSDNGEIDMESIRKKIDEKRKMMRRMEQEMNDSQILQMDSNDEEIMQDEIIMDEEESIEDELIVDGVVEEEVEVEELIGKKKRKDKDPPPSQPIRKKKKRTISISSDSSESESESIRGTSSIASQFVPSPPVNDDEDFLDMGYINDFNARRSQELHTQLPSISNVSNKVHNNNDNNNNLNQNRSNYLLPSQVEILDLIDSDTELVELEEVKEIKEVKDVKLENIKNEFKNETKMKERIIILHGKQRDRPSSKEIIEID
eukprot:TRINITY_DN2769_c0_g2_i1.p1 TRINITY_DN2769_c0_g2~~TRINITY_DN2769_c0_g2_i1.p1  ORF type:complete len:358 (-),score=128.46 TRINITY_DN2769_c0_g2_i1:194-1267(-)